MTNKKISLLSHLVYRKELFLISIIFVFFLIFTAKIWIVGDGVRYYAWLRSAIFDHNFDFHNEFLEYNFTKSAVATEPLPNGNLPNVFSIGPALIWAPLYSMVFLFTKLFFPYKSFNGYEFTFLLSLSSTSILVGFLAIITNLFLAKLIGKKHSLITTLAIFLATPLVQYLFDESNYAHIFSFFFTSLLLYIWLRYYNNHSFKKYLLLGLTIGLASLMRWQQLVFLILPISDLLFISRRKKQSFLWYLKRLSLCFISCFLIFFPQLIAWKIVFGSWIVIPQGTAFVSFTRLLLPLDNPLLKFLFSPHHGLFFWHPILLLGLIGLILYSRKNPSKGIPLTTILVLEILLLSSVSDWWAGAAFGARRIVDSLPLFTVSLAYLLNSTKSNSKLSYFLTYFLIPMAILWNCLLWFQYLILIPHDASLSLLQVCKNYTSLFPIFFAVINRSTVFTFLYQRAFLKAVFVVLVYCAIITAGLGITHLCTSMKFFPRSKEKE